MPQTITAEKNLGNLRYFNCVEIGQFSCEISDFSG